jgi:hypothetical protein
MVTIRDKHRDGRPERLSAAHAGDELDAVRLDLHPASAAVPLLATRQVDVDVLSKERQPRRHSLDERREPRPV